MNLKKNILKLITIFLVVLLTASAASAHHYRHHERHSWGEEEYQVWDNENVPPETVTDNSEYTVERLCRDNTCIVGGAGETLSIRNYANAKNPTYKQLISFLREDKTDEIPYRSSFVCSDYAVRLHDNAEKAGIKMGWCASDSCNHAWNVVETTDRGIVYVDCTGVSGGRRYQDKIVDVEDGEPLKMSYLFRDGGFIMPGEVEDLIVYW